MKNLFKSQNSSIRNWELTRDIASFIGAMTSIAVIWAIAFNNLSEALGNRYIAGTFAALTVAVGSGIAVLLPLLLLSERL